MSQHRHHHPTLPHNTKAIAWILGATKDKSCRSFVRCPCHLDTHTRSESGAQCIETQCLLHCVSPPLCFTNERAFETTTEPNSVQTRQPQFPQRTKVLHLSPFHFGLISAKSVQSN